MVLLDQNIKEKLCRAKGLFHQAIAMSGSFHHLNPLLHSSRQPAQYTRYSIVRFLHPNIFIFTFCKNACCTHVVISVFWPLNWTVTSHNPRQLPSNVFGRNRQKTFSGIKTTFLILREGLNKTCLRTGGCKKR